MKIIMIICLFLGIGHDIRAQMLVETRDKNEIGREFNFASGEKEISYSLSFEQTRIFSNNQVQANFSFIVKNRNSEKIEKVEGKVYCSNVHDILKTDSTGYSFNPKVCSYSKNKVEYIMEFEENENNYTAVNFIIFDLEEKQITKRMKMKRKEKK